MIINFHLNKSKINIKFYNANQSKISEKQYYYSLFEGKENFGAYFEISNNGKEIYSEKCKKLKKN